MEGTSGIEGARVENNKFCVSVHYRNVTEKVKLCATNFHLSGLLSLTFFLEKWMMVSDVLLLGCIRPHLLQGSSSKFIREFYAIVFQDWKVVAGLVKQVLEAFPRLKVTNGRMVGA